jgi:hypothetical protein
VALLFPAFVGSILVIVFSAMKSTDVYKEASTRAKADPAVIKALGSTYRRRISPLGKYKRERRVP